ncbi:hypothetical protein IW262DRAFT_1466001 [Armillaria fumosa]|nr:hypothetical protein IW262DRAFT_1466001 [Armillaria fumosa]
MSQMGPDFASIQAVAIQASDAWFNGVIIESLTHGMYTALIAVVLWRIVSSSTPHQRQIQVLAGISVFMYFMATLHLTLKWFYARRAFITNGETEETRFLSLSDALVAGGPLWIPVISSIDTSISVLLADCVIIWRCWIIWSRNWRIIVVPSLCTLCGTIFDVFFLLQQLTPLSDSQGNTVPLTPWGGNSIDWGMAYYSMTLSTTIICTMLIMFRLSRARAAGTSLHFMPNPYQKVMEIVVESAAIYVLALAVYIPFLGTDSPYSTYPQAILSSVTGIAPTLILLRVLPQSTDLCSPCNCVHQKSFQPLSTPETGGSATTLEDGMTYITATKNVQVV